MELAIIYVWLAIPFNVGGETREAYFLHEHPTVAAAKQADGGRDVRLAFQGEQISLDNPPPDSRDGSSYYLRFVHQPDGRNDVHTLETFATLADAQARLRDLRGQAGTKFFYLYRGREVSLR